MQCVMIVYLLSEDRSAIRLMKISLEDINLFRASQVCRGFVEVQSPVGSKNFREKSAAWHDKTTFKGTRVTLCHAVLKKIKTDKLTCKFVANGLVNENCKEKHW